MSQLPGAEAGRKRFEDLRMVYVPDMECVEISFGGHFPMILIPRDQIFSMEPEQDQVGLPTAGPVVAQMPEPEPVQAPAINPDARSSLSAPHPVPDISIPAKKAKDPTSPELKAARKDFVDSAAEHEDKEEKKSIFKRKPGRPKKDKE